MNINLENFNHENNNNCNQCGKCCRNHTVLITFEDVREIHKNYPEIPVEDFITLYVLDNYNKDNPLIEENFPIISFSEENNTIQGYLGIKFSPKNTETNIKICPFLDEESNLCKIHSHKPIVCRVYPHSFDEDEHLLWNNGRCNNEWNPSQYSLLEQLEEYKKGISRHRHFIEETNEWNDIYKEKTLSDFIAFILIPREYDKY